MTRGETAEVLALVASGQYEEALGVRIGASRTEINRAHIMRLNQFKDSAAARESLNRAKGLLGEESVTQRARRLLRLGKREEALAQLTMSAANGAGPEERHLIGVTLHQLGRDDVARGHLEAAVALRGDASDHLWLGYALERLGLLDEALAQYERAVRLRGAATECRQMGSVLMELERYDEALPLLNRAAGSSDGSLCAIEDLEELRRLVVARRRIHKVRRTAERLGEFLGPTRERSLDLAAFVIVASLGGYLLIGGDVVGAPMVAAALLYLLIR